MTLEGVLDFNKIGWKGTESNKYDKAKKKDFTEIKVEKLTPLY